MGKSKGLYNAEFEIGELVRIANIQALQEFFTKWQYHHKLTTQQLLYADQIGRVNNVSFYHGGDELYELDDIPGIWHEQCLMKTEARSHHT